MCDVLTAERTRTDAAVAECARLTTERAAVYRQAAHDRDLRVAAEEALVTAREERDAARAEAAGLRAAIAAERAVRAAWLATLPACASAPADVVAAEAATGAALGGEGR